jgi:hypothetical protein
MPKLREAIPDTLFRSPDKTNPLGLKEAFNSDLYYPFAAQRNVGIRRPKTHILTRRDLWQIWDRILEDEALSTDLGDILFDIHRF